WFDGLVVLAGSILICRSAALLATAVQSDDDLMLRLRVPYSRSAHPPSPASCAAHGSTRPGENLSSRSRHIAPEVAVGNARATRVSASICVAAGTFKKAPARPMATNVFHQSELLSRSGSC